MFLPFPMRDHSVPREPASFRGFVQDLAERLKAGRAVGIHCQGSIGRSTVTAACALIHLGWKPAAALAAIQEARGVPVPDMQEQEDWILNYKP
jgi:protein-tyrosine phosphatase